MQKSSLDLTERRTQFHLSHDFGPFDEFGDAQDLCDELRDSRLYTDSVFYPVFDYDGWVVCQIMVH